MDNESTLLNMMHDEITNSFQIDRVPAIKEFNIRGVFKNLSQGQIFGEISVLYGCMRTATIKSKQFGSCARVRAVEFQDFVSNFPDYKSYLEKVVIRNYDDSLKIFLVHSLRKIEWLKEVPDETLMHIAYLMNPTHRAAGD